MKPRHRIFYVGMMLSALASSLHAQCDGEAGVRAKLALALHVQSQNLPDIVRDYDPAFFPRMVFFRVTADSGFHTRPMRAAAIVAGEDTLLIRGAHDIESVWNRQYGTDVPAPQIALFSFVQLLFDAGILERGDRLISSPADIPDGYRRFLDSRADLSVIRAPHGEADSQGTRLLIFAQTAQGIVEYRAVITTNGTLSTTEIVIARLEMS